MDFEELDVDILARKAEGRIKAATLIQRRVRELERGWPALVPAEGKDYMQIAVEELLAGKIGLAMEEEAEKLREKRAVAERERARVLEAARRAEIEANRGAPAAPPPPPAPKG